MLWYKMHLKGQFDLMFHVNGISDLNLTVRRGQTKAKFKIRTTSSRKDQCWSEGAEVMRVWYTLSRLDSCIIWVHMTAGCHLNVQYAYYASMYVCAYVRMCQTVH